jgi:outer membrane lipoprotein-sorting protein
MGENFLVDSGLVQRLPGYILAAALGISSTPSASAVRRAMEARYRHAETLKAAFYERFSDGKGGGQAESGTVYFSRPGRMRWEYESPQKQLFIADGKSVWFYVPADHAASRAKINESSDWRTPIALLAGKADLGRLCRNLSLVEPPNGTAEPSASRAGDRPRTDARASGRDAGLGEKAVAPGDAVLRCVPREASDARDVAPGEAITDILLETDPLGYLVRALVREPGNLATEFRFGNWQENIPIPESKFHFEPPPGVSIVDEQSLLGQLY